MYICILYPIYICVCVWIIQELIRISIMERYKPKQDRSYLRAYILFSRFSKWILNIKHVTHLNMKPKRDS